MPIFMALIATVSKHLVFGYDSKCQSLAFAPSFGCSPLSVVDGHNSTISAAHFAFQHALFFGFDFNQFSPHCVVFVAVCDEKIWHIYSLFAS
jgi:hypothetical protein